METNVNTTISLLQPLHRTHRRFLSSAVMTMLAAHLGMTSSARAQTAKESRNWAEQAYPNLIHYNRLPNGGHFAAREQPQVLWEELRATFRSLR
jgi:pimeloyl-ACP methyl ester carboxylesterase